MITIECDACDRTFEVDSAEAGGRVECPHCGDVNRVPVVGNKAAHTRQMETPERSTPAVPESASGEKEIAVIRPAMFRAHPFKYLLIVLLILGGLTLVVTAAVMSVIALWLWIPGALLAGFGLGWFFIWWLNTHLWIKAVVTNKRTVRHEGIVRRHTTEVLHDHVRSVDINQNFVQRLFNVGYIGIDSAGQDGVEIEIRDIPGPYKVKEVIDRYRKM